MADEGKAETVPAPGSTVASIPPRERAVSGGADYVDLAVVDRGHYKLGSEIARGGMGRIIEARDRRLGRSVAIKEVIGTDDVSLARFEREVRITARLQHPGVVHVHEAGRWPSGQPFYVMKLIHGKPLDVRIASAKSLSNRLELLPNVIAVVDALAFAHSERVIHRDLKPANVLVGDYGETVVIDWGIAKDLTAGETDDVAIGPYRDSGRELKTETVEGAVIGTPSYMPPEQAAGERVDERADVYALGALLYQLLAGAPPYHGRTTAEVLNKVLDTPPEPLASRAPDAPTDLVAIVEKAMARDPAARFPTAMEMATELKRFQQGQLVASRRYTRWELARRWIRRYRAPVAVAAVALATLAVLAAIGIWRIATEQARTREQTEESQARGDLGILERAKQALELDPTHAIAELKKLSPGSQEWRSARLIASDAIARGVAHVVHAGGAIHALAFSPDGEQLVSHDDTGALMLWDLRTWTGRTIGHSERLFAVAMPDATTVVGVDRNGTLLRWRVHEHAPAHVEVIRARSVRALDATFDSRGTMVAIIESPGESRERRTHTVERVALVDLAGRRRELGHYTRVAWSPDGTHLICADQKAVFRVDAATAASTKLVDNEFVSALATDGSRVWVAEVGRRDDYQLATIVELSAKSRVQVPGRVSSLRAVANSGSIVAASDSRGGSYSVESLATNYRGEMRLIDRQLLSAANYSLVIATGWFQRMPLLGHTSHVTDLSVTPDGRIASGDVDGMIRIWRDPPTTRVFTPFATTSRASLTADGRELVVTRRGPALEVHDLATDRVRRIAVTEFPPNTTRNNSMRVERITQVRGRVVLERTDGPDVEIVEYVASRDGRRIATIDGEKQLVYWDLDRGTGRMLATNVIHVAIAPDGSRLVTSRGSDPTADHRVIEQWDPVAGTAKNLVTMAATALAYSSTGAIAITTMGRATIVLSSNGTVTDLSHVRADLNRTLAFSPDGKTLIAGGDAWTLDVWDVGSAQRRLWRGHAGTVTKVIFSDDGTRVASTGADNTVRIWRVADGASLEVLRGHTDLVTSMSFVGSDGFLTASNDRTARFWDLETDRIRLFAGHEDRLVFAASTGSEVITVDHTHQIARHPDHLPTDERLLRLAFDAATNAER